MSTFVPMTGTTEKQMWCAEVIVATIDRRTMVQHNSHSLIKHCVIVCSLSQTLSIENIASTSSVIPIDAPVYRYSMCNGMESHFRMCQLPRSDSGSTCPSIGTVNCTEGVRVSMNVIPFVL